MAELKTQANDANVKDFLSAIEHETRRENALELLGLFEDITQQPAVMWGESIVGFGRYHYEQRSGQKATWPITGFSPRKQNLSIYIMPGFSEYQGLLEKLGKHKHSVSCLYINKLADVDMDVLSEIITRSVDDMKQMHQCDE